MKRFLVLLLLLFSVFALAEVCDIVVSRQTTDICVNGNCESFDYVDGVAAIACPEPTTDPVPDPVPDPDPTPPPDPVPDDPEPAPTGAPYDLSAFNIPFAYSWPTEPATTRTINVSTMAGLRSAIRRSGVRVLVADGTYTGDLTDWGRDVDVVLSDDATLFGGVSMHNDQRMRWTGGNIRNGGAIQRLRLVQDILFNDVDMQAGIELHRENGVGGATRVAVINSTLDTSANSTTQFTIYSIEDTGVPRHEDLIFANVRVNNGVNSPFRIQWTDRVVVVDSAFNIPMTSGTGFRFSAGTRETYVADTLIAGRIHLNYLHDQSYAVQGSTWRNVTRWTPSNTNPGAFATTTPTNSGVIDGLPFFTEVPAQVGGLPNVSPFTASGLTPMQAWDGSTYPDVSHVGAER